VCSDRWRISTYPFLLGSGNPSREYTLSCLLYFDEGERESTRTRRSPRLPVIRLASAISHYVICIRVAADILATENPYKETHLRVAIRAIPSSFAKGAPRRRRPDRCWTDSPFLLPFAGGGRNRKIEGVIGELAVSWIADRASDFNKLSRPREVTSSTSSVNPFDAESRVSLNSISRTTRVQMSKRFVVHCP